MGLPVCYFHGLPVVLEQGVADTPFLSAPPPPLILGPSSIGGSHNHVTYTYILSMTSKANF